MADVEAAVPIMLFDKNENIRDPTIVRATSTVVPEEVIATLGSPILRAITVVGLLVMFVANGL